MARSLLPREHGAYAQLAVPMVAAGLAAPSLAGGLLAVAAATAFVANEPLLVVLGHRGARMQAQDGARARRRLSVLVALSVLAGVGGCVLAPHALVAGGLATIPASVLVGLAWYRRERSLTGELVAAVALTGAAVPVAVAGGTALAAAAWTWSGWALGYALTVVAVHRVIARHKRRRVEADALAFAIVLAVACLLACLGLLVALPLAVAALALIALAPSARHLRAIGFALVAASLLSLALPRLA